MMILVLITYVVYACLHMPLFDILLNAQGFPLVS